MAVVREAIEQCRRHLRVAKHRRPFREAKVGRDDHAANNTEEQFALGDFPDILMDKVIEGQEAHNAIADQLLQDKRVFTAMQSMLARMVYRAYREKRSS